MIVEELQSHPNTQDGLTCRDLGSNIFTTCFQ